MTAAHRQYERTTDGFLDGLPAAAISAWKDDVERRLAELGEVRLVTDQQEMDRRMLREALVRVEDYLLHTDRDVRADLEKEQAKVPRGGVVRKEDGTRPDFPALDVYETPVMHETVAEAVGSIMRKACKADDDAGNDVGTD